MKGLKCFLLVMLSAMAVSCNEYEYEAPRVPAPDKAIAVKPLEYEPLTRSQAEVADKQGEFGFEFFKAYAGTYAGRNYNILLSPFLMYGNLCAVSLGMGGEDYRNLVCMLGFEDEVLASKDTEITELYDRFDNSLADYFTTICEDILSLDESTRLTYCSALGFTTSSLLESYRNKLKSYYGINVLEGGEYEMKAWIGDMVGHPYDRANGNIGGILDGYFGIPANSMINVLTFDARWSNYNKAETRVFNGSDGISYDREYLTGHGSPVLDRQNHRPTCIKVYRSQDPAEPSALWLPYGNGAFSLVVMLPREGQAIGDFIQGLSYEDYKLWNQKSCTYGEEFTYHIPTIDINYIAHADPCTHALEDMGLNYGEDCNFERAVEGNAPAPVFSFGQGAGIKVTEEGTVAVAYSGQSLVKDDSPGIPHDPVEFIADRPFVYAIVDVHGTILFMGTVTK